MTVASLLSVEAVNTFYGESHVLRDVTFELRPGEVVGILGRNGVGKTTTLQTILGIPAPRSGAIRYRGEPISGCKPWDIVGRGIGWIPQGHRIFPNLSVIENLELAAARARPGAWSLARIHEQFPRLQARRDAPGNALSGGEQQMLAIARSLIQNPDLFLMDEPSEGLSPLIVQEIGRLIRHLRSLGTTILVVEQRLSFALSVADRVLIMNKGAIAYSGVPRDLEANPQIKQLYLGMGLHVGDEAHLSQGPHE